MTKNQKEQPEAYAGKYINVGNKAFTLVPELTSKGCKSCALEATYQCYKTLDNTERRPVTDYCRQGFILKKVQV